MTIKNIIDTCKEKILIDEKKKTILIKNEGFKSDIFSNINLCLSTMTESIFFYTLIGNNLIDFLVSLLLSLALNIFIYCIFSTCLTPNQLTRLSRFMPSNWFLKIMPKKIKNKIADEIIMASVMPVESLKELSTLVDKKEFDEFLKVANGEPTYKKMEEFFCQIEKEKKKEEKISSLSDSLYNDRLTVSKEKE